MQTIINEILEIDPNDPTVKELDRLAKRFGLKNMPEVLLEVSGMFGMHNRRVTFNLDMTSYQAVTRTVLSAAIVNYAVFVHQEFFVKVPEQEEMPRVYRTMTGDEHRNWADKYLQQVRALIAQFEN